MIIAYCSRCGLMVSEEEADTPTGFCERCIAETGGSIESDSVFDFFDDVDLNN